jgi:hypothetical protein
MHGESSIYIHNDPVLTIVIVHVKPLPLLLLIHDDAPILGHLLSVSWKAHSAKTSQHMSNLAVRLGQQTNKQLIVCVYIRLFAVINGERWLSTKIKMQACISSLLRRQPELAEKGGVLERHELLCKVGRNNGDTQPAVFPSPKFEPSG